MANLMAFTFSVTVPLALGLGGLFFAIAVEAPDVIALALGLIGAIILVTPLILLPTFIYAHIRQIGSRIAGTQKALPFVPAVANWREGAGDMVVVLTGIFFGLMFLIGSNPQMLNDSPYPTHPTDGEIAIAGMIGLVTTAYCYHFHELYDRHHSGSRKRANRDRNRQTLHRNKSKTPTTIVDDPIELELMDLRRKNRDQ